MISSQVPFPSKLSSAPVGVHLFNRPIVTVTDVDPVQPSQLPGHPGRDEIGCQVGGEAQEKQPWWQVLSRKEG